MDPKTEKFPPPFRWVKRFLIAYAILIPSLVASWYTWDWYAKRAVQQQIDAAHARGEPIIPEDFDKLLPTVDPSQNAAFHYEKAITLCVWTTAQDSWDASRDYRDPIDLNMAASITLTCAPALMEAYDGAKLPVARWSCPPSDEIRSLGVRMLGPTRHLANTLQLAALHHHHFHDDAAALRDVSTILQLAEALRPGSIMIDNLVADAIESTATQTLMEILPDLQIGTAEGQAPPQSVRELTALLLNDKQRMPDRQTCWFGERCFALFYNGPYSPFSSGTSAPGLLVHSPLVPLARARNAAFFGSVARSVAHPYYFDMHPLCDTPRPEPDHSSIADAITSSWDESRTNYQRAVILEERSLTDRRLAATALAIKLFEVDHPAKPFAALEDLVPDYLQQIPPDPFAPDHHAIRYQPAAPVPRLYSVSDDGVDDHGSLTVVKGGSHYGRTSALDLSFYLKTWAPPR